MIKLRFMMGDGLPVEVDMDIDEFIVLIKKVRKGELKIIREPKRSA